MVSVRTTVGAALALTIALLALSGCATREVLATRDNQAPDGVDLTGHWVLRTAGSDTNQRLRDAEIKAAGGRDVLFSESQRRRRGNGSLVHVFLESGRKLKITQTGQGLFVSFDRSIVEEYRFGEYRPISVGPVTADRSSGWEGDAYVIETLDREGNKLLDRYELIDNGDVLLRHITIYKKQAVDLSLVQTFDKN